jgi:cytosine/uracil/thiamine/allantoin permease
VHWPAIIAQLLGMSVAALWLNAFPPYVGPLASRVGGPLGSDFSVFLGLAVGGLAYWLLARREVTAEGKATPAEVV